MSQTFVKSFTHLKDRPHADRALPMLQRVAVLVKPIMRKHGWIVPVLSEFFPDSPNLVGESLATLNLLRRLKFHSGLSEYREHRGTLSNILYSDMNGGEQILLRLRPPWTPDTFYEEDQVVRVMLHEARNP
jgi:hypothetical protein